jgi:putative toxin-antitoxin system antitoxin component (TIGR02293 family)
MDSVSQDSKDVERYRQYLKTGGPGSHFHTVLLGLQYFDLPNVLKAVEKGFPFKTFERLAANMNLSSDRLAEIAGIPKRTVARRKVEKQFTSDESDRLLRVARVFGRALRFFDGDRDWAIEWLTTEERALGVPPAQLLSTSVGAQEVERIIGALEHGIVL